MTTTSDTAANSANALNADIEALPGRIESVKIDTALPDRAQIVSSLVETVKATFSKNRVNQPHCTNHLMCYKIPSLKELSEDELKSIMLEIARKVNVFVGFDNWTACLASYSATRLAVRARARATESSD